MARKSKKNNNAITVLAVALVLLIGFLVMNNSSFLSIDKTPEKEIIEQFTQSNFCSNNPDKILDLRIEDVLATSMAYINGTTIYLVDSKGNIEQGTITAGTTGSYTAVFSDLVCGGDGYKVFIKAGSGYNSGNVLTITKAELSEERKTLKRTIKATQFTPVKVKAFDEIARTNAYDSTNSTDYVTSLTSTFYAGTGSTSFNKGTYDALDITFTLAVNESNKAFGEGYYIAVNTEDASNVDDWLEETISISVNGKKLSPVAFSNLPASDQDGLKSYEAIFFVETPIGMDAQGRVNPRTDIRFYVESGSTDPDYNPVIRLVPVGDIASTQVSGILENVGFQDDTSKTAVFSAQTITISVS